MSSESATGTKTSKELQGQRANASTGKPMAKPIGAGKPMAVRGGRKIGGRRKSR